MAHIHRNPPFRAEHLGSLLRPKELLQKRALFEKNELSQAECTKAEDEAVDKVVKVQLDCGFHGVSDGEYRCDLGNLCETPTTPLYSDVPIPDAPSSGELSLKN
jgi:hypothetical protein